MDSLYDDFTIREGDIPLHIQIEGEIAKIGMLACAKRQTIFERILHKRQRYNYWKAHAYKNRVLRLAGWDVEKDGHFGCDPERAARILRGLALILSGTNDPQTIMIGAMLLNINCNSPDLI